MCHCCVRSCFLSVIVKVGLDWVGLGWVGLGWIELGHVGAGWVGFVLCRVGLAWVVLCPIH